MKTIHYKIIRFFVLACVFFGTTFAATPGFYIGGTIGYSMLNTPRHDLFLPMGASIKTSRNIGGFGGQIFAGKNYNQYIGVELGWIKPADSTYSARQNSNRAKLKYTADAWNLMLRFNVPFKHGFGLFGKFGYAYMRQEVKYNNPAGIPIDSSEIVSPKLGSHTYHRTRPIFGGGFDYYFNDHFSAEISYTMVNMPNKFKSRRDAMADIQLLGIGIIGHL